MVSSNKCTIRGKEGGGLPKEKEVGGCDSENLNAAIMPVIRTEGEGRPRGAEAGAGSREEAKVNETWQGVTEAYGNRRLETQSLKV